MGVSKNQAHRIWTQNTRIPHNKDPKIGAPLVFINSHLGRGSFQGLKQGAPINPVIILAEALLLLFLLPLVLGQLCPRLLDVRARLLP